MKLVNELLFHFVCEANKPANEEACLKNCGKYVLDIMSSCRFLRFPILVTSIHLLEIFYNLFGVCVRQWDLFRIILLFFFPTLSFAWDPNFVRIATIAFRVPFCGLSSALYISQLNRKHYVYDNCIMLQFDFTC